MTASLSYTKQSIFQAFREGNLATKLSFVLMGFANLANRQLIKGGLFLLSEILFIMSLLARLSLPLVG